MCLLFIASSAALQHRLLLTIELFLSAEKIEFQNKKKSFFAVHFYAIKNILFPGAQKKQKNILVTGCRFLLVCVLTRIK